MGSTCTLNEICHGRCMQPINAQSVNDKVDQCAKHLLYCVQFRLFAKNDLFCTAHCLSLSLCNTLLVFLPSKLLVTPCIHSLLYNVHKSMKQPLLYCTQFVQYSTVLYCTRPAYLSTANCTEKPSTVQCTVYCILYTVVYRGCRSIIKSAQRIV